MSDFDSFGDTTREGKGIRRMQFLGIAILMATLDWFINQDSPTLFPPSRIAICLVYTFAIFFRLLNTGDKPIMIWWLLALVPLFGILIHIRCLTFPEDYHSTRKMDLVARIGMIISIGGLVIFAYGALKFFLWSPESW